MSVFHDTLSRLAARERALVVKVMVDKAADGGGRALARGRSKLRLSLDEPAEPDLDELLGLALHAREQVGAGRDVLDEADRNARRPDAGVPVERRGAREAGSERANRERRHEGGEETDGSPSS